MPANSVYHLLRRIAVVWATEVVGLWGLARILPGLHLDGWRAALLGTAAIGLFNALVRPALVYLTLPFTVFTFGLLTIVLNAAILFLMGHLVPGMHFADFGTPFIVAFGLAAINTLIASVLSLNDEDSFYRNVIKRIRARSVEPSTATHPGMICIEIDGLALPVLRQAMREGYVPTISSLLASGKHKLMEWDCGLPSQTSSAQGGVLWGNNFDIPGFRWFDKTTGKLVESSSPSDAEQIENRIRTGTGLLGGGGMSIGNMFAGGASRAVITVSEFGKSDRVRRTSPIYFNFYINPYTFTRMLVLMLWEVLVEWWEATRARLRNIEPRVPRGGSFPFLRAMSTVMQHEVLSYLLPAEMFGGVPIAYATFVGYDMIAHHAGPYTEDSLKVLRNIDRRIKSLMRAAEDAPRPYRFVFLSDHGQTPCVPFEQVYEKPLDEIITTYLSGDAVAHAPAHPGPGWEHVNLLLTETIRHERLTGRAARRLLRQRTRDGIVQLGDRNLDAGRHDAGAVVCASGNLALIYFTEAPERLSFEAIVSLHPELIRELAAHDGIGHVMVHSEEHGPIVLGRGGVNYLQSNRVEGDDPLLGYGAHARKHLLRLDGFPHAGDIVVSGRYDPGTDIVISFEEMVGTHGGIGGGMTQPFILYPSDWSIGDVAIDNATDMHNVLMRWRSNLEAAQEREVI